MMRAVIVDDEPRGRKTLEALLAMHCPEVNVVATADSAAAGIETIRQVKPDVVFLDIQMPQGSGFHLLENVRDIRFEVIFTTAHDQYALKAIKFSAVDYLLKPIDGMELADAVGKAESRLSNDTNNDVLEGLLNNYRKVNTSEAKIALPYADGLQFVKVQDIVRFEASGSYTEVTLLNEEKMVVSKPIKVYDDMLSDSKFFRVHNSHLINLNHIVKYIRTEGGRVEMQDTSIITVSRKKKDELLQLLSEL